VEKKEIYRDVRFFHGALPLQLFFFALTHHVNTINYTAPIVYIL